jgi:hypothetical protein
LYDYIYEKVTRKFEIFFPKTEDTAVTDPGDIDLNLPDRVVAGGSRRIVTDFGMDVLGYNVN